MLFKIKYEIRTIITGLIEIASDISTSTEKVGIGGGGRCQQQF